MNDTGLTKIIFEGVKFYWRTRNTIDVTMVDHGERKVTEVILFDPSLGKEAPRVYINSTVLESRLDDEIEHQLHLAMQNGVPITEKFTESVVNKAKSAYILHRLEISEYDVESKKVVVTFQRCGTDYKSYDLICEKPELNFQPFRTGHGQQLMADVVDQAIQALHDKKAQLQPECKHQAQVLEKITTKVSTPKSLAGRERWRIPIVFVKISHSKCLSLPDTKILRAITQNIKSEEDAVRMAAVLAPSPSKQRRGGFGSGGDTFPAISPLPTAPSSPVVSFCGNTAAAAIASTSAATPVPTTPVLTPVLTPVHSPVQTASEQSKLLLPTSASRHRTEGVQHHPAPISNSRQISSQQNLNEPSTEGHGDVQKMTGTKEPVAAVSFHNKKKKKATSKTPRAHKKNLQKSGSRAESQPILNQLRKLSFSLTGGRPPQQESAEGCNAELDISAASAASEDELALHRHGDGLDDAMLSGTMQRVIANLGALNNSLRASFGLSAGTGKCRSDKTAKGQQGSTAAAAGTAAPITGELVTIMSQTSHSAQEGVDTSADIAVLKKPAAAGGTDGRTRTLTGSGKIFNSDPIPSEKQSAAAFNMQKFFAGLVRWRSNEKVYVEAVGE